MANKDEIDAEKTEKGEETAVLVEKVPESQETAVQAGERASGDTASAIESLKRQIEEEKRGRLEAEGRAQQAVQLAHRAETEKENTDFLIVEQNIETFSDQNRHLKADYARAMHAQDYNRAADINEAIAINASRIADLQNGKMAMQEKMQARAKQPAPPPPRHISDPVEALATQLTPKSASWLRSHPEYARDHNLYAAMIGAHNVAVGKGMQSDSPAYFAEVERVLGIGQPAASRRIEAEDDDDALSEASQVVSRRSSPPAAPVSRSGAAPGAATPRTIRLTAAQVEVAKNSGLSPEEYWKNLQALKSEGRMN